MASLCDLDNDLDDLFSDEPENVDASEEENASSSEAEVPEESVPRRKQFGNDAYSTNLNSAKAYLIGEGAHGKVFGLHEHDDVAIKRFKENATNAKLAGYYEEFMLAHKMRHNHLVFAYDFSCVAGKFKIALEKCDKN